ncbi:MAG: phosphoribosylformylglycinamidine cyclo-ligase [Rhodocyclaceae bacterium]|nr:phosphoribosylformylglycinamidine cyclo-ligase [Rhodocyclaceae bacterium]
METRIDYKSSGVDYSTLDPIKVAAQVAAKATAANLSIHGIGEVAASRGESAYVVDAGDFYLASITECLGTKALVADAMRAITGRTYYENIAQDTIAMAVNDLITVGATPLSVHAYWAAGGGDWFADAERANDLVRGWQAACDKSGVAWGGGETPALAGVVSAGAIDLAASCVGWVKPKSRLTLGEALAPGDAIVLLESSGIHSNGVSLARKLAGLLPQGYATPMGDGRLFGEALLDPTVLYVSTLEAIAKASIAVHYAANITGHGWLKLMRHPASLTYRFHTLPPVPPVLQFICQHAKLPDAEAYSSLNMGAGFALYVSTGEAARVVELAAAQGVRAYVAGVVESGPKRVIIEPLGVEFGAGDINLRA